MAHLSEPILFDVPESLSPLARYKREHQIEMRMHGTRYVVSLRQDKHFKRIADVATEIKALNRLANLALILTFEQWRYANHV